MSSFKNDELELSCISLTDEIKRGNPMLNNKKITIFNSSVMPLKNSNNFLVASRGWYGNVRSWDGINFIILSITMLYYHYAILSMSIGTGSRL